MSKIDTSSWKEFKLGDILRKIDVNKLPYRISDLPKAPTDSYTLPAISSGGSNQGITCYVPEQGTTILQNVISIASNGDGYAFWQPDKFTIIQDAYAVERADGEPFTENAALFLVAGIQKILNQSFSWTNKSGWNKVKECSLTLPYKTKDVPDWDYMQERIAELEQERIAELEQYLITTGLNDYELTDECKSILNAKVVYQKFLISDVFELKKGQRLTKAEQLPGNIPFIGSSSCNNGVTGYIGQKPIFRENAITVSYNGSVGQVFYQETPFWASDDINVLYLKGHALNHELFGYLGAVLSLAGKGFSYVFKWNIERMSETVISLPIQTDSSGTPIIDSTHKYHKEGYLPGFEYMEKYIRAIEKLVIKDVVRFKDDMIKKTKELCDAQKGDTDGEAA